MKVLQVGTFSAVTGADLVSGVSSPVIDMSSSRFADKVGLFARISGDLGRTGGSVAVYWKGSYSPSGASWAFPATGAYFCKSGTSISGTFADGTHLKSIEICMPFIKIMAVSSKSGSTMQGSGITNTCRVDWAVAVPK